ncbi:hypothetical protein U9M48_044795 [Paspalum notatum var. saurae]|uniref:Protein kinase domain-containing protein n=1 Tax=Paspalum notatum var. saurae TaxID=547442 RepID=A0AAQ3V018_PASNO
MPLLAVARLLLLLAAAAALPRAAHAVPDGTYYNATKCHPPVACGGSVVIRYPFFLADAASMVAVVGDTAYSYCGYPGMAVACEDGRATLRLKDSNYTVLAIDYANHNLTVADADVLDRPGDGCPRVTHNVTVPTDTWLNLSATADDDLVFFFDCVFTEGLPPPPPLLPINCSSFQEQDGAMSFVAVEADLPPSDQWPRACKEVFLAPVLKDMVLGARNDYYEHLNSDGYGELLKQGFQLSWDPSRGPCFRCEQSNGQCSYNQSGEFIGCLCSDGHVLRNSTCGDGSPSRNKRKITADIVSAVSGAALLSLFFAMCLLYHKKFHGTIHCKVGSTHAPSIESFLQKHEAQHPKRYTYSDVKRMTGSFSEKLGKGGFGTVYKGNLQSGRPIAVKLLNNSKDDGQEFMNEVASIMRTSHVNIVSLLGYCLQGSKRALIYEYMPNGSLERFATGQNSEGENSISWEKLFDITVGVARGLEYLHRGCSTRIVHFDIKPHNILLDEDFCPKISDFGLAKLCMKKESIISIEGARGTIGYIAPEVFSQQFGQVSSKSDVYSFGMMILEMVGARKNINKSPEASSKYFPQWVYEHLEEYCANTGDTVVDSDLVRKLIVIGLWCIQLQPSNRPSMTRVVEMLESRGNDLQIPPQSL